jgi:voltage-gated potassium channel
MDLDRKIRLAAILPLVVLIIGVLGYKVIGGPQWTVLDCVYMTVITLGTVGYGETHDMTGKPALRLFTIVLIIASMAVLTYAFTVLTTFVFEGEFDRVIKRRRMSRGISDLKDHFIVCGAGDIGVHIIHELQLTRREFVCIDLNPERTDKLLQLGDFLHIVDDATDDGVLLRAGVQRAKGLLACLSSDKDNLFVTISARALNPHLRIVAKAIDVKSRPKLERAGADAVVSPQLIGGLRLVSELIRPHVVGFLDGMLRDQEQANRIEEVLIGAGSAFVGIRLRDAKIRKEHEVLVLAVRDANAQRIIYTPSPDTHLRAGSTLVVMGNVDHINQLRKRAGGAVETPAT